MDNSDDKHCLPATATSANDSATAAQNDADTKMPNTTPTTTTPVVQPCPLKAPLVVTIVGLPWRGKSHAAHKIARHLCWRGEFAKVFTVESDANCETLRLVETWFRAGNNVALIDGMHLQRSSRQLIIDFCARHLFHHLVVEFECDPGTVRENIAEAARFRRIEPAAQPDWTEEALKRLEALTVQHEPVHAQRDGALIRVRGSADALAHSVCAHGVQGALQTSILGVLSSPVMRSQLFYFSRHGESVYNVLGRIGGDADLSLRGRKYADRLTAYLTSGTAGVVAPKTIWTSELCRTIHTVENIPGVRVAIKDLNEINAGICESLTYEEIQERFPQEFAWRDQDKLKYRYPHGESYLDLLQRVDNVVMALLTNTDVMVVSHQAVLRCIMAYFNGSKPEDVPYINVPLHTLLVVTSHGYRFQIDTVSLNVDCVDTYRIQPKNCSPERTDADALDTVPAHFDAALPQASN